MKQLIISVSLIISAFATFAQQDILNGSFESREIINDTVNMLSDTNATGWTMSSFGAGVTDDAYTGNSAAYIWNWYYYAHGELTNGLGDFPDEGGTPSTFLPTQMTGYYKYIIGDVQTVNDSALAVVCLTKFNSTTLQRDTVGIGIKKLGDAATYTSFKVDINYLNGKTPDTVTVKFVSSENGFCSNTSSGECLFFYVDDVEVSDASTGISEEIVFEQLSVYPNPVTDVVNITAKGGKETSVQLFNALGESVWSGNIVSGKTELVNISHLPSGMYFVKEQAANGKSFKLLKQ